MLSFSEKGYAVLRSFEGRSLKAYRDEVGVWTIGFGNTNSDADVLGFEIKAGVTINETQAEQLMRAAITRRYEESVRKSMPTATQPAYDAGVDFHYNTGAISRASWVKSFAANNLTAVHSQIMLWNKAGGNVLAGLTRRRNREWEMIASGDYGPEGAQHLLTDEKGRPISAGNTAPAGTPTAAPAPATPASVAGLMPWHARMESILGLYEFSGDKDNEAILAMAKQCGGSIARDYKHDSIPWCALTVSWSLITTGFLPVGKGSLAAIDFKKICQRIDGPAVGAIGVKARTGGNHVFIVRGRTASGQLVGTGGNQSDMVCDTTVDPTVAWYGWPPGVEKPARVGFETLPIVTPRPHTHKAFSDLPGELHPAVQHLNPPKELLDGTGMLRNGDHGQEVKDAKALLVAAGYKLDMNNDKFGPATEKAVRDYQHKHPQLEESGILDPATRAALKRDASMKGGLKTTTKAGGAAGTATGGTDVATGLHTIPWEVYAVGGVVFLGIVAFIAWKYRDEIRAFFTRGK
jgi:uncharacterized protein (TIGR02594 family)